MLVSYLFDNHINVSIKDISIFRKQLKVDLLNLDLFCIYIGLQGCCRQPFFWEKGEKAGKRDSSANSLSATLPKEFVYELLEILESVMSIVIFEL